MIKSNLSPRSKDTDETQVFTAHKKHAALMDTVLCPKKSKPKSKRHKSWTKSPTFAAFPALWNDNYYHPCWSQLPALLSDSFAHLAAWNQIVNRFMSICKAANLRSLRKHALPWLYNTMQFSLAECSIYSVQPLSSRSDTGLPSVAPALQRM